MITVNNTTTQIITAAINEWGSDGNTNDFDISSKDSETWNRSDPRGFILRLDFKGNEGAGRKFFVHADDYVDIVPPVGSDKLFSVMRDGKLMKEILRFGPMSSSTITLTNATPDRIEASINRWGQKEGNTNGFPVLSQQSESWNRGNDRGYVLDILSLGVNRRYYVIRGDINLYFVKDKHRGYILEQDVKEIKALEGPPKNMLPESWMSTYWADLEEKTFSQIAMPSSHDTGMSEIHGATSNVTAFGGISRTQALSAEDQILQGGVRIIDLRPAWYRNTGRSKVADGYYCAHCGTSANNGFGVVGRSWSDLCKDIQDVLDGLGAQDVLVIRLSNAAVVTDDGIESSMSPAQQREVVQLLLNQCIGRVLNGPAYQDFFNVKLALLGIRSVPVVYIVLTDGSLSSCGFGVQDGIYPPASFKVYDTGTVVSTNDPDEFYANTRVTVDDYKGGTPVELAWHLTQDDLNGPTLQALAAEINPQLHAKLVEWTKQGIFDRNWPAMISWDFVQPASSADQVLRACLRFNQIDE